MEKEPFLTTFVPRHLHEVSLSMDKRVTDYVGSGCDLSCKENEGRLTWAMDSQTVGPECKNLSIGLLTHRLLKPTLPGHTLHPVLDDGVQEAHNHLSLLRLLLGLIEGRALAEELGRGRNRVGAEDFQRGELTWRANARIVLRMKIVVTTTTVKAQCAGVPQAQGSQT